MKTNMTVTTALRETLIAENIMKVGRYYRVYSDPRVAKGKKAVGVKIMGVLITDEQKKTVIAMMKIRGFECNYINKSNDNMASRFCFFNR